VDDILLFYEVSRRDVVKLKEIIDLYYVATRMKINVGKSTISFMWIDNDNVRFVS
jgi:hypothetical protein